jgi:hypothetical protein
LVYARWLKSRATRGSANFSERRACEVRRITLPRTPVNNDQK